MSYKLKCFTALVIFLDCFDFVWFFPLLLCFDCTIFCLKIDIISTKLPRRYVVLRFPLHKPFCLIILFVCLLGMSRKPSWVCEKLQPSSQHQSKASEMNGIVRHLVDVPSTICEVLSPSTLGNPHMTCLWVSLWICHKTSNIGRWHSFITTFNSSDFKFLNDNML